jgi:hypothetical protein
MRIACSIPLKFKGPRTQALRLHNPFCFTLRGYSDVLISQKDEFVGSEAKSGFEATDETEGRIEAGTQMPRVSQIHPRHRKEAPD